MTDPWQRNPGHPRATQHGCVWVAEEEEKKGGKHRRRGSAPAGSGDVGGDEGLRATATDGGAPVKPHDERNSKDVELLRFEKRVEI